MRKTLVLAVTILFAATAQAQIRETYYGRKVPAMKGNGVFTDPKKVHSEFRTAVTVSGGDGGYTAYGLEEAWSRQFKLASWGLLVHEEYSAKFGAASAGYLTGGLRFGKTVSFGPRVLVGLKQTHEEVISSNGALTHTYKTSRWKPEAGLEAELALRLGKGVALSVFGRYTHTFFANSQHELAMAGWEVISRTNDVNRWTAGLAITALINKASQASGDNRWSLKALADYGSLGPAAVLQAQHYKRASASSLYGRLLGVGTSLTFKDGEVLNRLMASAGVRVHPAGADSPLFLDFTGELAAGQYATQRITGTTTEDATLFNLDSKQHSFGVGATAHADMGIHLNRAVLFAGGYAGGWATAGVDAEGNFGYQAHKIGTKGFQWGVRAGLSIALGK